MRKVLFFLLALSFLAARAQEVEDQESMTIDEVFNACAAMQESLERNDTVALSDAADKLRKADADSFDALRCKDKSIETLDGHFVFHEDFVDSLEAGQDAYRNAEEINKNRTSRGTSKGVLTKTCLVKAGKSTKYTFVATGRQELGVITEPGGRVYVRVHVTNKGGYDVRYNDDKNAAKGTRRYRKAFNLPAKQRNTVELEIINKSRKDTSFVVISH